MSSKNKIRKKGSDSYPDGTCPYNPLQFSWNHQLWWEGYKREEKIQKSKKKELER